MYRLWRLGRLEIVRKLSDPFQYQPLATRGHLPPILEGETKQTAGEEFGVGMNPEFLREGTAIHNFLNPDKVVLGGDDDRTLADMHDVFDPLVEQTQATVVETNTRTAKMVKYANNSFLAAKAATSTTLETSESSSALTPTRWPMRWASSTVSVSSSSAAA